MVNHFSRLASLPLVPFTITPLGRQNGDIQSTLCYVILSWRGRSRKLFCLSFTKQSVFFIKVMRLSVVIQSIDLMAVSSLIFLIVSPTAKHVINKCLNVGFVRTENDSF